MAGHSRNIGHPPQFRRSDAPEDDPYRDRGKRKGHSVCGQCGAEHVEGRWRWPDAVHRKANGDVCPACRRTRDRVPAGQLTLRGPFPDTKRDEIMRLVRNVARRERMAHPMKRIMRIVEEQGVEAIVIQCTDAHLPRDLGQSVRSAFGGTLEISYGDRAGIVRADWAQ